MCVESLTYRGPKVADMLMMNDPLVITEDILITSVPFSGFPRQTTPSHPLGRPQVAQKVSVDNN